MCFFGMESARTMNLYLSSTPMINAYSVCFPWLNLRAFAVAKSLHAN